MKYKLSIVVPMYNAEPYVVDCLESILKSDLPVGEYEVVIVNDGSTDGSKELVENYINGREDFYYVEQENQGSSGARNTGIKCCHGEYIWFVDADDRIDSSETRKAYDKLISLWSIDVLAFQLKEVTEDGRFINLSCTQPGVPQNIVISGRDAIISGYAPSSVCALFLRREMLVEQGLFFKMGMTHQDVELTYRLMTVAEKVMFTDMVPYLYIRRNNTISTSVNPQKKIKYLGDELLVYQTFKDLASHYSNHPELCSVIDDRANNILWGMLLTLYRNKKLWRPLGINETVINMMKEKRLYPIDSSLYDWKKRIVLLFLNRQSVIC